ncbi:hypothetical protein, partial [Streptococcus pneumoniae]|uniref:hypothetical protein n=1 Tax=Streptococcus pneumoniae TaxID=1313 RepID=UPI0013DCF3F9
MVAVETLLARGVGPQRALAADDPNHLIPRRIVTLEAVLRVTDLAMIEVDFSHEATSASRIID